MSKKIHIDELWTISERRKKTLALKLLRGTREKIARRGGWTKGQYFDAKGGCCLLGGLHLTAKELMDGIHHPDSTCFRFDNTSMIATAFGTRDERVERLGVPAIHVFNDRCTRKSQVLKYLDERIAALEGKK